MTKNILQRIASDEEKMNDSIKGHLKGYLAIAMLVLSGFEIPYTYIRAGIAGGACVSAIVIAIGVLKGKL